MATAQHRFSVALTGGIASGKTLISDTFATLGATVIDTDVIAHQIVEVGEPALAEIERVFGSHILADDGSLKRQELRTLIFADPVARRKLETILHPRIRHRVAIAITEVSAGYCILVIPLLAVRGAYPDIDRVLVIDVSPQTQIERLMARDHASHQQALQALAAQPDQAQRLAIADDVLDNSGSPQKARQAVAKLHQKYTRLARNC